MPIGAVLILMVAGFCLALLAINYWFYLARRLARERARQELCLQLARSAGSAREAAEFLQSGPGKELLEPVAPARCLEDQLLASLRWGVFLFVLGAGICAGAAILHGKSSYLALGALAMASGAALVASAELVRRIRKP